jgi:putative redox protein
MAEKRVRLDWTGQGLVFRGGPSAATQVTLDSDGIQGPSPTDFLLLSLAGCMGVDVQMILEKSRVPVETLAVDVSGERAPTQPRRFTSIRLVYEVRGPAEEHQARLERAVALSRDKYCSVLHSLQPDIDLEIEIRRV